MSGTNTALATLKASQQARVAESLVLRGDISLLTAQERVTYYLQMCQQLGLNASAQPFTFLKLNGKELLYAGRGCTDQLARIHGVTRELIDQPKVIDIAGTKVVYAVCKATLPNGRSETATATLPLADPTMVFMKVETKAKRRATLALLGLALLDETEVHDIPTGAKEELPQIRVSPVGAMQAFTIEAADAEADEDARRERDAIQGECEPPLENSPMGRLILGLTAVECIADASKLWRELGQPLHTAGVATEAQALVSDHMVSRGYYFTAANLTAVLAGTMSDALRTVFDGLAVLGSGNPVEDAAAVLSDLREHLSEHDRPEATRAAVRRLVALGIVDAKARLGAILSPKGDGPKGGAKPTATKNTTATGSAAASSQGDGALALVTPEVIRWRDYIAAKAPKGADRGAAAIAGSYWKHCTGDGELADLPAAQRSLVYSAVLDELELRGISEPHSYLDEIGEKNGALVQAPLPLLATMPEHRAVRRG